MSGIGTDPRPGVAETHTAVLFFAADRAYKIKKAVHFPFVDFRQRDARAAACHREVVLNRRLAPDVYLGVAVVADPDANGDHDADGDGEPIVVMRRMPVDRRLARLVTEHVPVDDELREIARLVAAFHAGAATGPDVDAAAQPGAVRDLWTGNLGELAAFAGRMVDPTTLQTIEHRATKYLAGRAALFDERIREGHIRDGHGDLLADDIFCLDDGPRILDCLEFDDHLRYGDVLADAAFLAMDLERLGRRDLAQHFLRCYREFAAGTWPASLADHYIAYRALVRAKVPCARVEQGDDTAAPAAAGLLDLCLRRLEAARVRLVVIGGPPGTGKTTLATAIAAEKGWIHLSSDEIRKELAGIPLHQRASAPWGDGIYSESHTAATYEELLRRAGTALEHGESVVIDASWSSAAMRAKARSMAAQTAAELVEVECRLPEAIADGRLAACAQRPGQTSDADATVAHDMRHHFDCWPEATPVNTVQPVATIIAALGPVLGPAVTPRTRGDQLR